MITYTDNNFVDVLIGGEVFLVHTDLSHADRVDLLKENKFFGLDDVVCISESTIGIEDIAHTIEHVHPIGRKKPFNMLFNVGPASVSGGNEVINNIGFKIDSTGYYPATFGPAMRRIIDFKDVDQSITEPKARGYC